MELNWDAVGAIGEILGAIAVFVSLLYLGIQIRNSSNSAQSETERQIMSDWNNAILEIWRDEEIASIIVRGQRTGTAQLSEPEAHVFSGRMSGVLHQFESIRLANKKGLVPDAFVEGSSGTVVMLLSGGGGAEWWANARHLYPPIQRDAVDDAILKGGVPLFEDFSNGLAGRDV